MCIKERTSLAKLMGIDPKLQRLTLQQVLEIISQEIGIPQEEIITRRPQDGMLHTRQLVQYFSRLYTRSSLQKIGEFYGNFDHSTVIHSCRTVLNDVANDEIVAKKVQRIKNCLLTVVYEYPECSCELIHILQKANQETLNLLQRLRIEDAFGDKQTELEKYLAKYNVTPAVLKLYHSRVPLHKFVSYFSSAQEVLKFQTCVLQSYFARNIAGVSMQCLSDLTLPMYEWLHMQKKCTNYNS